MKIIFLDIDGVLINGPSCRAGFGKVAPECVARLNRLIETTGAAIVLSSCWRVGRTRIECCDLLLEWGVKGKVLDRTRQTVQGGIRGDEIQDWLNEWQERHGPAESFVILDDDRDMGHLLPYLVHTSFMPGLTDDDIEKAAAILEGRRAAHIA